MRTKKIDAYGDYFYCQKCKTWHKFTKLRKDKGTGHIIYIDIDESNSDEANYFYCGSHRTWHKKNRADKTCLSYKLKLEVTEEVIKEYGIAENESSKKGQGYNTAQLGENIHQWIEENCNNLEAFYDHGKQSLSWVGESRSIMIVNENEEYKLSDVDIIIVDKKKDTKMVIEVEESSSTPKTIIGDIIPLLLADYLYFGENRYNFNNTILIIIFVDKYSQKKRMKIERTIEKLNKINESNKEKHSSKNIEKIISIPINLKTDIPTEGFEQVKLLISSLF